MLLKRKERLGNSGENAAGKDRTVYNDGRKTAEIKESAKGGREKEVGIITASSFLPCNVNFWVIKTGVRWALYGRGRQGRREGEKLLKLSLSSLLC